MEQYNNDLNMISLPFLSIICQHKHYELCKGQSQQVGVYRCIVRDATDGFSTSIRGLLLRMILNIVGAKLKEVRQRIQ